MKHKLAILSLSLALTACSGGDDSTESTGGSGDSGAGAESSGAGAPAPESEADKGMVAFLGGLDEITAALKDVKDEASAKAAADKIREVGKKMTETGSELEALTDAEISAAAMRYSSQLQKAQMDMSKALMPVGMNPTYAQYITDAMKDMPKPPTK